MYTNRESTQNRKIWCKHIYAARQLMIDYIMEHKLSGCVNVYHPWLKNIVSLQVASLCPIMLSSFHLWLPETAYIYSSASFLVTAWWQHFGFKMIFKFMTSIELLLHAEYYCKHILVFLPSLYDTHKNDVPVFESLSGMVSLCMCVSFEATNWY